MTASRRTLALFMFAAAASAQWRLALTGSTASFRGIHDLGNGVIWASGTNGTILRSEDNGYMWQECSVPPDAVRLDFRAVFAWDANHADVMSSGSGDASRLYETTDGCARWHLIFRNPDRDGFWDALQFRGQSGFLLGDPVNGRFVLYRSDDLGRHWHRDGDPGLASAPEGEGVFAGSNSSLVVLSNSELLFATGGVGGPRVFRCIKGQWTSSKVPMAGGKESAGIFSLAFRDHVHGVAAGGDYQALSQTAGTAAWTSDGGVTWHPAITFPSGYRSAVAWDHEIQAWIAAGPNGTEISRDDGRNWQHIESGNWNALSPPWIAGPKGRIASLDLASALLR